MIQCIVKMIRMVKKNILIIIIKILNTCIMRAYKLKHVRNETDPSFYQDIIIISRYL